MRKARITITVDGEVLDEVSLEVETGAAESTSAWISAAMAERLGHERRMAALAAAIADYEAEFGPITDEELERQAQIDRDAAALVRQRIANAS